MGRQLCVGDIHGALKGVIQAFERANVTPEDTIIFLGDYVDGWANMPELIQYLIELSITHNCIFIRGNHDEWCEKWLTTTFAHPDWLSHGGLTTKMGYENSLYRGATSHIMFFYKLNKYYIDEKNRLFVHGGYTSETGVKGQNAYDLMWNRDLFQLALLAERNTKAGSERRRLATPKRLEVYNEVFVGHTTTMWLDNGNDQPIHALNMWNLDTGAGSNGRVTIMDVDTNEYWQSDKIKELYPDDPHNEFCKLHS